MARHRGEGQCRFSTLMIYVSSSALPVVYKLRKKLNYSSPRFLHDAKHDPMRDFKCNSVRKCNN